jgi:hypothetical protein
LPKETFLAVGENCNKVSKLLEKAGRRSISKSSDGNKFVQAPVATKTEVKDFVKTLLPSPASLRLQRKKEREQERLMPAAQKSAAEPMENLKPRVPIVTPETLSSDLSPAMMRHPTTLPYQPEDSGVPASPSVKIPLPDSPDVVLSIDFCREKIKKNCFGRVKDWKEVGQASPVSTLLILWTLNNGFITSTVARTTKRP